MCVAELRGVRFTQSSWSYWYPLGEQNDALLQAVEDVYTWLGFETFRDYLLHLQVEQGAIFKRAQEG